MASVANFSKGNAQPYIPLTVKSGQSASPPSFSTSLGNTKVVPTMTQQKADAIMQQKYVTPEDVLAMSDFGAWARGLGDVKDFLNDKKNAATLSGQNIFQGGPLAGGVIDKGFGNKLPDASQALEQLGPVDAMSSIPAGPGGGNIDGFAKGDNCGRPAGDGSGTQSGIGEGATPGQKEFVPPESLKNDPEFQAKLNEMKGKYPGLTDQQIYNVIGGESGFNFKAVNGQSGATGAFQFIPSTASSLGYSTADIQNMSPAQQLGVYDKYLSTNGYKGGALGIMQAAPAYASKPSNFEVYPVGSKAWAQNPGWRGSDGKITVASINRYYGY